MSEHLLVQAVMHPFPHSIGADQSLEVARNMMQEHNIRHLPVQLGGSLVGILSDRDLHYATSVDKKPLNAICVRDVYTENPYIVEPEASVSTIARRMAHDHIGCALIAREGKLLGIFTTVDACRTLAEVLSRTLEQ